MNKSKRKPSNKNDVVEIEDWRNLEWLRQVHGIEDGREDRTIVCDPVATQRERIAQDFLMISTTGFRKQQSKVPVREALAVSQSSVLQETQVTPESAITRIEWSLIGHTLGFKWPRRLTQPLQKTPDSRLILQPIVTLLAGSKVFGFILWNV